MSNNISRNYCTYHNSPKTPISLTKRQVKDMENIQDYVDNYKKLNWIINKLDHTSSSLLDGKGFLMKNFKLSDVQAMNDEDKKNINGVVTSIKNSPSFKGYFTPDNIDYISFLYNESLKTVNPLNYRVSFRNDLFDCIGQTEFFFPVSSPEFIKSCPPALLGIYIDKLHKNNPVSGLAYVHELAHTQIERIPETYSNINNQEVISLLLELIYSYHFSKNSLLIKWDQIDMFQQMIHYKNSWNKKRGFKLADSIYLNSLMYALDIFYTYRSSNQLIQREMLMDIQNIFDGNYSVEDYINKYSAPSTDLDCDRLLCNLKK